MNVLIAFYSKADNAESMANALKNFFKLKNFKIKFLKLKPKKEVKVDEYSKLEKIDFEEDLVDVKSFDLIIVGTPVSNFSMHPVVEHFVRKLKNVENKKFGIFCSSVALAGKTVQKLSGILSTMGADVVSSVTVKSLFDLNEKKTEEIKKFASDLLEKIS